MVSYKEIVIGRWYVGAGRHKDFVVKVASTDDRYIFSREYITSNMYSKMHTLGSIKYELEDLELCSQEYLNKYLPEGHVDQLPYIKNEDSINKNNKKENGKNKENSNEVLGINSNEPKSKGRGKVTVSSRRQSVSTGSRFKGNETIANYCRTEISSIKITRRIIISGHN